MKTRLYLVQPNGLRENAETAIFGKAVWACQEKERGIPVIEGRRKKMHRCAVVAKQKRVGPTLWEHVTCTRRNWMC